MWLALRSVLLLFALGFSSAAMAQEIEDHTALAAALKHVTSSLEDGLKAVERLGKPISAKFTLEHGFLQLSLWVTREDSLAEFILYPATRTVTEIYEFRDPNELKTATAHRLAMEKARVSLRSATANAVQANPSLRAVSAYPVIEEGDPMAVITLLDANAFKIVTKKLY
jgi:hypothetical protein